MPLNDRSLTNLVGCDPRLSRIAASAIERVGFTVIVGHRSDADQDQAFAAGLSKLPAGKSKHNASPSLAFDFIPAPFTDADWKNTDRFREVARVLTAVAKEQGVAVRWGGTWSDKVDGPAGHFVDSDHFELV